MSKRLAVLASVATLSLGGCYIVPVGPDGRPVAVYPVPPHTGAAVPAPAPVVMPARLYPSNETASPGGVLSGTVTNHLNGRGEFQLVYNGETLAGEATRVQNDTRRGIANAYGTRGTYLNCQYQMSAPTRGAGTCTMSNGGQYNLHIGG
jgi:hypothetical protein